MAVDTLRTTATGVQEALLVAFDPAMQAVYERLLAS